MEWGSIFISGFVLEVIMWDVLEGIYGLVVKYGIEK